MVTLRYIYIQMMSSNPLTESLLKIYEIGTYSTPRIVYRSTTPRLEVIGDTGNYYANADHLYFFSHISNILFIREFRSPTINFTYTGTYNNKSKPLYRIYVLDSQYNENLTLNVSLLNFDDKSIKIDSSLREEFQQQVVKIDLKDHIKGPLLDFYCKDEEYYLSGLYTIDFTSWFENDNNTELLAVRLDEDNDGTKVTFVYLLREQMTLQLKVCDICYLDVISKFELQHCNDLMDTYINLKSVYGHYDPNLRV